MNHEVLEIGNYYIHEKSRTMWHPIELNNDMPFTRIVVELKNEFGDKAIFKSFINANELIGREGTFKLITKKEWDER